MPFSARCHRCIDVEIDAIGRTVVVSVEGKPPHIFSHVRFDRLCVGRRLRGLIDGNDHLRGQWGVMKAAKVDTIDLQQMSFRSSRKMFFEINVIGFVPRHALVATVFPATLGVVITRSYADFPEALNFRSTRNSRERPSV